MTFTLPTALDSPRCRPTLSTPSKPPRDNLHAFTNLVVRLTGPSSNRQAARGLRDAIRRNVTEDEASSAYLALAGYGNDAHGITAAAEMYYHKTLDELDPCEAATLVNLASRTPGAEAPYTMKRELRSALYRLVWNGYMTEADMEMCLEK